MFNTSTTTDEAPHVTERDRCPVHPGAILQRECMEPLALTVTRLARIVGVSRKTMSTIVNERASISADMALRLSRAFETSPEFWLNLQRSHDLWRAAHASEDWKRVTPAA